MSCGTKLVFSLGKCFEAAIFPIFEMTFIEYCILQTHLVPKSVFSETVYIFLRVLLKQ